MNNIRKIDILYAANIKILTFSYDPIKKALESRIKNVDFPQIIRQPNLQTEVIDLSKLVKSEEDFPFFER